MKIAKKMCITSSILLFVLLFIVAGYIVFYNNEEKDERIRIITENYKTEIILYGEDISFDDSCYVRHIDTISKEELTSDTEYIYSVFIINDLNGTVELSQDELEIIKSKVFDDKIDLFYFGRNNYQNFVDAGIFSQEFNANDMFLGVIYENEIKTELLGVWDTTANELYKTKNEKLLADNIYDAITSKIRYDNR